MTYSALQQKGFELAERLAALPLKERLGIIARTFGCETAKIEMSACTGRWQGYTDIYLALDDGTHIGIGTLRTSEARSAAMVGKCVNSMVARYHPDMVSETKRLAAAALMAREAADNEIAFDKGLKPYTFLNVELCGSDSEKAIGFLGWYYVTLAVDGKIFGHHDSGLANDIYRGVVSEQSGAAEYYVAAALPEGDVDYVFRNVGHSSHNGMYQCELSNDARNRAEQTLAERERENEKISKAAAYIVETSARETLYGNYITYPDSIPDDIMTESEFLKYKDRIADELYGYEAVAQVDIEDDGAIDVTMYLAYCPNYEPDRDERDEYPDDREILDALSSKIVPVPAPEKPTSPERKPSLLEKLAQNKQKAAAQPSAGGSRKKDGMEVE